MVYASVTSATASGQNIHSINNNKGHAVVCWHTDWSGGVVTINHPNDVSV